MGLGFLLEDPCLLLVMCPSHLTRSLVRAQLLSRNCGQVRHKPGEADKNEKLRLKKETVLVMKCIKL